MSIAVAGIECARKTTVSWWTSSWKVGASGLYAPNGGRKYRDHAEPQRGLGAMTLLKFDQVLFALTLAWMGARVSDPSGQQIL